MNALTWLGCQNDDAYGTLQRVITAVSTAMQNLIGRNIAVANYTSTFDGRGRHRIMMPNYPITAVSSVVIGEFMQTKVPARSNGPAGATPGFTFNDKFVYVDSPYLFEKGRQNVIITYSAGYTSIPLDLEQACLIWIKAIMDSSNYSATLKSASAGQTKLDWSFAITKLQNLNILVPPTVLSMLSAYRRVAPSW